MCPPGTADCPCDTGDTCGAGLACEASVCVPETEPPCDAGTQGCACAADMCAGGLECTADVCVPVGCTPGEADCACADGACDDGLACNDGVCGVDGPVPDDAISVTGADVRGCDLLFREGAIHADRVRFKDGLVGEWMRRDGLLAMAFVGPGGAVVEGVGAIVLANAQIAGEADLELLEHTCFDANGHAVPSATVVFK